MFGFLKLPAAASVDDRRRYRQAYACLCSWQRQSFGLRASVLISYEAVFLYQLAVDYSAINPLAHKAPTCCRLRNDTGNQWHAYPEAASFATAFALLLARTKLEDDVRDSGSLLSRAGRRFWQKATDSANEYFKSVSPNLVVSIEGLIEKHISLEQTKYCGPAEEYCVPTAQAFGTVFESFALHLVNSKQGYLPHHLGDTELQNQFQAIGRLIGKGILLSDCVFDFDRDRRHGNFNPISSQIQRFEYQQAAAKAFVDAGWVVEQIASKDLPAITCQILNYAFQRIAGFKFEPSKTRPKANRFGSGHKHGSIARAGECDIPCDGCCECGDCGACGGVDGDSAPCNDCLAVFLCVPFSSKDKPEPYKYRVPIGDDSTDELIESTATTDCILNPTGYIVDANGKRHPAKTDGQFCEADQQVKIVAKTAFGFLVEPIDTPPSK